MKDSTLKSANLIDPKTHRLLMGNEAMARGLIEAGVSLAASYPGTPASEILTAVVAFAKEEGVHLHAEWSVNEKVAYETALANAMTGRRSAVAMKQVGLKRRLRSLHALGVSGRHRGPGAHRGRRPRAAQLPDRAGQPLFRHVRQGAGAGPRLPPGGQGPGGPGLRALGEIRNPGDAAPHHPGLPRPAKRHGGTAANFGATRPLREKPRALVRHAPVFAGSAPAAQRQNRGDLPGA